MIPPTSSSVNTKAANRAIVIMAGGTGTRLWPLSKTKRPKQFHALISSKTLLCETFERAKKVVPKENIFISTTNRYRNLVHENLPEISDERLIIEPATRSTAPAIALASAYILKNRGNMTIATIASDHAIGNVDEFTQAINAAFEAIERHPTTIATIGINPSHPSTAFGYIKMGKELEGSFTKRVFFADAFKEKPKLATAKRYLAGWEYLWNAGYFVFSAESFLNLVAHLSPAIFKPLEKIRKEWNQPKLSQQQIEKHYLTMPEVPIDTEIMERMEKASRLVVPTDLEWDDIGNWEALYDFLKNRHGQTLITRGNHTDLGSDGCFVSANKKLIATLNLKDVVIIDSDDALLVANRKTVGTDIKKLLEKLKSEGKHFSL
jgi:mannose-1-phosphate guanylyltransferase